HPVKPAERRQAAQKPSQLGMRADHALVEDDAALGVDAGGDIGGGDLARRLAQLVGVLRLGQRVQIDNAEDAVVIVLQRDPVADRAEIIAEMQIAGRLDAGKNSVHGASGDGWRLLASRLGRGQAGCPVDRERERMSWPRSSRQPVTPSPSASAPNTMNPAATSAESAPRRSISGPAKAGASSSRKPSTAAPMASAAAVASASVAPKAPRWNRTVMIGCASTTKAAAAGKVNSSANSTPRFCVAAAPARSPVRTWRDKGGRIAVATAIPTTPSGNW